MSGLVGAILGEGGAALGGMAEEALTGEAATGIGARVGRAAGQDVAQSIKRRQQCKQAYPDQPEAFANCNSGQAYD